MAGDALLRVVLLVERDDRVRVLLADADPEAELVAGGEQRPVPRVLTGEDCTSSETEPAVVAGPRVTMLTRAVGETANLSRRWPSSTT